MNTSGSPIPAAFGGIAALTFDCYGTLIDWERGLLAALAPLRATFARPVDDDAVLREFGAAESRIQRDRPRLDYPSVLAEAHRALARAFGGITAPERDRAFGASVGDWPAFEDSAAALARLARRFTLVVVSNVDRASLAKSVAKLGDPFAMWITAQEVGAYKPDRRMFDTALERLMERGIARDRILHVAQSLFHDIAPARALGWKTAWIDRRGGKPGGATPPAGADVQPDARFASLAELAAALAP